MDGEGWGESVTMCSRRNRDLGVSILFLQTESLNLLNEHDYTSLQIMLFT